VQNSGTVKANVSITDMSLDGNGSISSGAVGSTVSNSSRIINYADNTAANQVVFGAVNYQTSNSGTISVSGGMSNSGIVSGYNLATALTATGASSAFNLMQ